jgi:hypothetical protein
VIAQVNYSEQDCHGIPSKVSNLQLITHDSDETEFGTCVNGIQWNYLSTYPSFNNYGAAYGATYLHEESCDPSTTTSPQNYYGFDFRKADICIKVTRQNTVYSKSNVQGCEGENNGITINYYFDSLCNGNLANSILHSKETCASASWNSGDDQDDFKQDQGDGSANYVIGQVHNDYCYDPTHSLTPSPIEIGSCSSSYFYWVGDGFCDPTMNTSECNYDGGDCCQETCIDKTFQCGIVGYNCLNPNI